MAGLIGVAVDRRRWMDKGACKPPSPLLAAGGSQAAVTRATRLDYEATGELIVIATTPMNAAGVVD